MGKKVAFVEICILIPHQLCNNALLDSINDLISTREEGGFARSGRSTIAYGPLLRVSGRTPLLRLSINSCAGFLNKFLLKKIVKLK